MAFVAGPRDFVRALNGLYNSINTRGGTILEQAITEMLKTDVIGQFARKSLKVYQYRRDIMSKYLDEHLNGFAHYEIPIAGLAYCVKLPLIKSIPDLWRKLLTDKIWIPPDDLITAKQNQENIIRLGFASHSASELERGIKEISNIIK